MGKRRRRTTTNGGGKEQNESQLPLRFEIPWAATLPPTARLALAGRPDGAPPRATANTPMMPRCLVSTACLTLSLCASRALKFGDGPHDPRSVIEVELYHVAFGKNKASSAEVAEWAQRHAKQLEVEVQDAIDARPGAPAWRPGAPRGPAVASLAELRPSQTRAGGGEEAVLRFDVSGMAAEAMGADLRAEIERVIAEHVSSCKGAVMQQPTYKSLQPSPSAFQGGEASIERTGAPSGKAVPGGGDEIERKRRARRDDAASGFGDPHLTNMHGEHFDLYKQGVWGHRPYTDADPNQATSWAQVWSMPTPVPRTGSWATTTVLCRRVYGWRPPQGVHTLIEVPRRARPEDVLLRVDADALRLGAACEDLYFEVVNITGRWTRLDGGLQFFAQSGADNRSWTQFGEVYLKVVRGHTASGIVYLNVFVKRLGRVSYPVGGLLGEDDHMAAATPGPECSRAGDVDLQAGAHADGPTAGSIAEADVEG
ncbi:unnamed protein product [Prorocentrum cordatum]|uniref:Uncharacterized protein n=1 Tax=Prorocentrum cordatum TaxID=2364126 RepID=A0ABN9U1V5_9DINO|nr:unnamed protein product [Polarella glacialis]